MNKIFLGGTCAKTTWRDTIIANLNVDFFNPVVEDWTPECQLEEYRQKEDICNVHLYVITNAMQGVFSIAEVIDSVMNGSKVTILHVMPDGFGSHELKSLQATVDLVRKRGGIAYISDDLHRTIRVLNTCFR